MFTTFPQCNCSLKFSRNTQSKSYKLPLTECVWEFQNNALWDTLQHALLASPASRFFMSSDDLALSCHWVYSDLWSNHGCRSSIKLFALAGKWMPQSSLFIKNCLTIAYHYWPIILLQDPTADFCSDQILPQIWRTHSMVIERLTSKLCLII